MSYTILLWFKQSVSSIHQFFHVRVIKYFNKKLSKIKKNNFSGESRKNKFI